MYKDYRHINAGENEFYRYGRKAVELASLALKPNESGFYSIPVDAGKYWTIGTSTGKYGEFARINGTIFSVNRGGFMYAKAGTDKGEMFVKAIEGMIDAMKQRNHDRVKALIGEEEE